MNPARRNAAVPIVAGLAVLCVAVYWYALRAWFFFDDFAWLGLPFEIHSWRTFWAALFEPRAQGTVRTLSDRLPFLVFGSLFGINETPFRILAFATEFLNLALLFLIARRLTGSTLAGAAAGVFWVFCEGLATPMAWASGYNQILWACCMLASFWLFLRYIDTGERRYWIAQWATYLLGFGVLELNVLYPAIALLYALLFARQYVRKTLWLFAPAILFTIVHTFFIPKVDSPIYRMYFDRGLPQTFFKFLTWSLGPSALGELVDPEMRWYGHLGTALIVAGLIFVISKRWRADGRLVLFLVAWFLMIIAPLTPLKNHAADYYPAVPAIGFCILGGWAFGAAWNSGIAARAAAIVLALIYCAGNYQEIYTATSWYADNSRRLEQLIDKAERMHDKHPNASLLLDGIDWDLYAVGFNDRPFRLYGLKNVYILPATMQALERSAVPLRGLDFYRIGQQSASDMLARGDAVAISTNGGSPADVTNMYKAMLGPTGERSAVNVAEASHSTNLGGQWHRIETGGYRWMGKSATVKLAGPQKDGEKLYISGYAPKAVVAGGPLKLAVEADGVRLGAITIRDGDQQLEEELALPHSLVGKPAMTVQLSLDRTITLPNDDRQLGLIFGRFEVR